MVLVASKDLMYFFFFFESFQMFVNCIVPTRIPNVNCIVPTRICLCEGCPAVGVYFNMVVVWRLYVNYVWVFCTFSLKDILVLVSFLFVMQRPLETSRHPLGESSRGLSASTCWGNLGCQTGGANLVH